MKVHSFYGVSGFDCMGVFDIAMSPTFFSATERQRMADRDIPWEKHQKRSCYRFYPKTEEDLEILKGLSARAADYNREAKHKEALCLDAKREIAKTLRSKRPRLDAFKKQS